jgi:hypothetical protein
MIKISISIQRENYLDLKRTKKHRLIGDKFSSLIRNTKNKTT